MNQLADEREVLLFDLGGVLIHFEGFDALNRLFENRFDATEIRSRWLACIAVTEFERGKIAPQEFAERFVADWGLDWSPERFLEAFASWVDPLTPEVTELLAELGGSYPLACLSNCNPIHWERLESLRPHFDATFLSFEMGLAKPAPAIFEEAIRVLGVAPDRITFFDDTVENVRTAQSVGMRSELVRGVPQLKQRLSDLGKLGRGTTGS